MRAFIFSLIFFLSAAPALGAVLPNDPFYDKQADYLNQAKIPAAWSSTTGSKDVVVAVIDSGVDMDHPDIIGNMWFNPGEVALNGLDDDNNGYVDDLNGWDFLAESPDPHPKFTGDATFAGINHGTSVAGVIAASSNNSEGLAGVCWQCKIMALRAVDATGSGNTVDVARAVRYALANGADIINMSFVGSLTDAIMTEAMNEAYAAGALIVAAVGNDAEHDLWLGGDLDFRPLYPVCSDGGRGENHILGVGSVDSDNKKSSFSNYGFRCIDINAPGNGIAGPQLYDPRQGQEYDNKYRAGWKGTSFAAPIIAGVAGLMKSINPRLTNDQIIGLVRSTGRNLDSENPLYVSQLGRGLVDAERAVLAAAATAGLGTDAPAAVRPAPAARAILISPRSARATELLLADSKGEVDKRWPPFAPAWRGGASLTRGDVNGDGASEVIAGAGPGGGPQVRIFSGEGALLAQWFAGDKNVRGGVNVAAADTDGDGAADIITAVRIGQNVLIKIFNYQGQSLGQWAVKVEPRAGNFSLAAADVNADGKAEIITAAGSGSLPMVRIFDRLGNSQAAWLAFAEGFRGGVNVAAGDTDADGEAEVITAPGAGGGPQVRIFSPAGKLKGQFFAFEKEFRGGAAVAAGNADADRAEEIIVGAGAGRAAAVSVFSKYGADFVQDGVFPVFEKGYKGGVNVGI